MAALKTIDLFSGCGGFSQGLTEAGFDIRLGIEYKDDIIDTYNANFAHPAVKHDLMDWQGAVDIIRKRVGDVDVVAGSPPCVEFSRAGRQCEGDIASLTICYAQIVCNLQPSLFIMENVPDVVGSQSFERARVLFEEHGYSYCVLIRDARYSGCPQNRRRAFVVGCAATQANEELLARLVARSDAQREPLTSIAEAASAQAIECPRFLFFPSRNKYQAQVVSTDEPYPTMRSCNGICMNQNPMPENYIRRPNDAAEIHEATTLSVELAACVSSFPQSYKWPENRRQVGIMLGNCVPPALAKYIGTMVKEQGFEMGVPPEKNGVWIAPPKKRDIKKTSHISEFFERAGAQQDDGLGTLITIAKAHPTTSSDARELRYTIGGDENLDAAAIQTMGFHMKTGWTFIIKERVIRASRIDDMFVAVPGQPVPFRGKAMLIKNKHLP